MHLIRARDFMQTTVSNLEALSMFVLRVHGKKTANGAGYTGPIRKMTSPAMTAAVLRTKSGALSPLQHVLQVQKAKISALRSVVKRLQDGRPPEHHTSPTKSDHSVRVNFLSKRVENELSSPASDEESSLQHQCRLKSPSQTRSILPSVRQAMVTIYSASSLSASSLPFSSLTVADEEQPGPFILGGRGC